MNDILKNYAGDLTQRVGNRNANQNDAGSYIVLPFMGYMHINISLVRKVLDLGETDFVCGPDGKHGFIQIPSDYSFLYLRLTKEAVRKVADIFTVHTTAHKEYLCRIDPMSAVPLPLTMLGPTENLDALKEKVFRIFGVEKRPRPSAKLVYSHS